MARFPAIAKILTDDIPKPLLETLPLPASIEAFKNRHKDSHLIYRDFQFLYDEGCDNEDFKGDRYFFPWFKDEKEPVALVGGMFKPDKFNLYLTVNTVEIVPNPLLIGTMHQIICIPYLSSHGKVHYFTYEDIRSGKFHEALFKNSIYAYTSN